MPRKKTLLPPIPRQLYTTHGYVPVLRVETGEVLNEEDFGAWDSQKRIIYVRKGMHRTAAWLTLFHEQCHANLDDIDPAMNHETVEVICNTIATARLRELEMQLAEEAA